MDVLAAFGVPVLRTVEAYSAEEAGKWAAEAGSPVALKVLGPVHKSEGGGVQLGLEGHDAVVEAYEACSAASGAPCTGVAAPAHGPHRWGRDDRRGAVEDPAFGPLVVFGLGGVTVEVLGDHVTRLAPLTDMDAHEMVTGLRGSKLLTGFRGMPPVDIDGLVQVLLRVSRLVEDMPEVAELDCNPVIVTEHGAVVVDARIRVDTETARPLVEDTRHLH